MHGVNCKEILESTLKEEQERRNDVKSCVELKGAENMTRRDGEL